MYNKKERKLQFTEHGIHHATINGNRFHLRPGGKEQNLLWINGRQPPMVLDQTAAEFMKYFIDAAWKFNTSEAVEKYVVEKMYHIYGGLLKKNGVKKERIKQDFKKFLNTLMNLAKNPCPAEVPLDTVAFSYGEMTCPARMDLAVTYKCNLKCTKCYASDKCQKTEELGFGDWVAIYKELWKIGVPQVVFTGGEPTLREDIVDLVDEAEEFVTGLVTNGTMLASLAKDLKEASLDYVQITIESYDAHIHDKMTGVIGSCKETVQGIRAALKAGLQVVTNTTLTKQNADLFPGLIKYLYELGVKNIACNTLICSGRGSNCKQLSGLSEMELKQALVVAQEMAGELDMSFDWYSPTCYTLLNPVELGLGQKACSAATYNMTIQPDGTVLPCQSWPDPVGNILSDRWEDLWNRSICKRLRAHSLKAAVCEHCVYVDNCGGGCPLDRTPRIITEEGGR